MSLMRQVGLLLLTAILIAFVGSTVLSIDAARHTLQTELALKNSDNAATLALALSQQQGDQGRMEVLATGLFDTGFYRSIRYLDAAGKVAFERRAAAAALHAPAWLATLAPIAAPPGVAQVSDGWRALGSVEVVSQDAYAYDALWRATVRAAGGLALLGAAVAAVAVLSLMRWRPMLARLTAQAQAIERGDYSMVDEPGPPELRRLARAMNAMAARLKRVFEAHAAQVDVLRRQASEDALTGLSNRAHFMARLTAALHAEDGVPACGLVLWRVPRLGDVNAAIGRPAVDRLLQSLARVLETHAAHVPQAFIGRINASDFAVVLPGAGQALTHAQATLTLLRETLPRYASAVVIVAGAIEVRRGTTLPAALATADLALARAESRGAYAVETGGSVDSMLGPLGEAAWGDRLREALTQGRAGLGGDPVIDPRGRLVHWECPLRMQLEPGGPRLPASHWLPLALRARLTVETDARALTLALADIERDGQPRCINLAPASLADSGFAARLRGLLLGAPRAAAKIWLEVAEVAAAENFELVQELGRQVRPTGARFGLEHAGERLRAIERLYEAGLDFVKLDATTSAGIADDPVRARYVSGLIAMLRPLALQVFAEGVANEADARALWDCGVDAITGPWASRAYAVA
ncbi:MAG: EAL domain-containing protein [Proteobacteria bacterium]|nr:EAL domain-containing protein [Pseudomonadota bacterium]